jgi:hypothetical protein
MYQEQSVEESLKIIKDFIGKKISVEIYSQGNYSFQVRGILRLASHGLYSKLSFEVLSKDYKSKAEFSFWNIIEIFRRDDYLRIYITHDPKKMEISKWWIKDAKDLYIKRTGSSL